jgi:hypothetical protein
VVHPPLAHHHRPPAEIKEKEQIVVDDDQGAAKGTEQFLEHLFLAGIEVGGGLIEDQHLRLHGHDGGESGAFFLAVAEMMRRLVAQGL